MTSPIERAAAAVASPLRAFLHAESTGGIVLVAAAATALVWANSPAADGYIQFWQQKITFGGGQASISLDLRHWVNDALMVLFFFVIGLEIKRELAVGELRDRRAAILPAVAAVAGVMLPALIYLAVVGGGAAMRGWASRWPPTSRSPSASWRCWAGTPRAGQSCSCSASPSSTTSWPSVSSRSSTPTRSSSGGSPSRSSDYWWPRVCRSSG